MNLKGSGKILVIIIFSILAVGLLPLLAWPLPYEGLDWVRLGDQIYYETPTATPTSTPTATFTPTSTSPPPPTATPTATPTSVPAEPTLYLPVVLR